MNLILAYGAGLLTLINPCVLPILPIVLATAVQRHRWGPVAMAAGMGASFVALGVAVSAVGFGLGLTPETVANAGAVLMILAGTVLMVPAFSARFAVAAAGVSAAADRGVDAVDGGGIGGAFATGALMGAVWSPCVGPTLGGALALAGQGESLPRAAAIMAAFSAGVGTVLLGLAYGARSALQRRRAWLGTLSRRARPILGAVFVLVGIGILSGAARTIEGAVLQAMPAWLVDLSVSL